MIDPLSRLAILYGTDKFGYHDYTPNYHELLSARRGQRLSMLEIGVGGYGDEKRGGESLEVWRDYFPEAQITGIDIQKKTMDLGPRVSIMQGSQIDSAFLEAVVRERGPFDIILDDGSHRNEHVVETFGMLYPRLKQQGVYIVEDVQTAFIPRLGGSLQLQQPNSVGFFAEWLQRLASGSAGDVVSLERFHNIVVVHKGGADGAGPTACTHRAILARSAADAAVPRLRGADIHSVADLSKAINEACETGVLFVEGWPDDLGLIHDLFVQIDHREIAVHYPDAPIHEFARHVLGMAAFGDGLILELGDNDYPSNFAFEPDHRRAVLAMRQMEEVLADPAAHEGGLLNFARMVMQFRDEEELDPIIARLASMGCTDRRYFEFAVRRLRAQGDMERLCQTYQEGVSHYPDNDHLLVGLARTHKTLGDIATSERMLQDRLAEKNGRSRVVANALSHFLQSQGRIEEAISVAESAVKLFPAPDRPRQLKRIVELCRRAGLNDRALRACEQLVALDPSDGDASLALEDLRAG
jgi:hypothetical protein